MKIENISFPGMSDLLTSVAPSNTQPDIPPPALPDIDANRTAIIDCLRRLLGDPALQVRRSQLPRGMADAGLVEEALHDELDAYVRYLRKKMSRLSKIEKGVLDETLADLEQMLSDHPNRRLP